MTTPDGMRGAAAVTLVDPPRDTSAAHEQAPLDWEAFAARRPGHRDRHDLRAVAAYGEYRRQHEQAAAAGALATRDDTQRRAGIGVWESEGGGQTPADDAPPRPRHG